MEIREAVIVDTGRTAIGKRKGALANWHPTDLLGFALRTVIERNELDPGIIDDVVGGCVTQSGEQGTNVTRNAWVAAGLPWHVPATSVDRQCGSSQQAVHFVAQGVMAGAYDIAIACGVESMTRAPMASNSKGGTGPFSPSFLRECNGVLGIQFWVAQVLADKYGITRDDMDAYAVESHRRAQENTDNGFFAKEIIPVPIKDEQGELTGEVLAHDEGIRPGNDDGDPRAPRAGDVVGSRSGAEHHRGQLVADERRGLGDDHRQPRDGRATRAPDPRRFTHFAVAAEDPVLVLSAPVPVTHKLLDRTGMKIDDFDAIECNEAFAAIALMWAREFEPDMARFNPRGGAIAIGHPLGASGVRLMTTMLNHLEHTGGRYGFQTMCEGGGQANATVIERLG